MTLPGPSGVAWALGLLAWAGAAAVVGELVRRIAAQWVESWRSLESIERLLMDFYLGGATMYLVAAVPGGAFVASVVFGLPVAAGVLLLVWVFIDRRRPRAPGPTRLLADLFRPSAVVAVLCAIAVFAFELVVASPIATGNTYDSSLLTLYVSLLLQHHTIPLSFQPYAPVALLYPQGTTVWLGWAQLVFSLPPARTSLLVTPLFFALVPLGGFVFGRRAFDSDRAGVAFALLLGFVGSWTRVLVYGSNDFVFAFPLVLVLAGQSIGWLRGKVPSFADAVGFGLLVGYSAALNPVGAEWLLPALLLAGLLVQPAFSGAATRWLARWVTTTLVALVALLPTLYVLVEGGSGSNLAPGSGTVPPGIPTGITTGQFVGSVDPYLFRPSDIALSPLPILRVELAILLTLGMGVLVLARRASALGRYFEPFRPFVVAGIAVLLALLGLLWAASTGFGPAVRLAELSSAAELSIWLFTLYTLVGGSVLVVLLERVVGYSRGTLPPAPRGTDPPSLRRVGRALPRGTVTILLVLLLVVPGVALTPTALPPVLTELYHDYGNVTAADFALLSYAGAHLPAGARVLIAPGSAAGFLPGYATDLVLLYPLVPGWEWLNSSYRVVVSQLTNATLNSAGLAALASLDPGYIVVTGNNTILWPAFSPTPLLDDPSEFALLWHEEDAYLFEQSPA
ncbi:MAG: hypothetical protein L3J68_01880 [Thermoplasmata archaeon]|nr:hypothetical protein [Thermoplasmata archaeon]